MRKLLCAALLATTLGCTKAKTSPPPEHTAAPEPQVDAGLPVAETAEEPAPPEDQVPVPACDALVAEVETLIACDKIADDVRQGMRQMANALVDLRVAESELEVYSAQCTQGIDGIVQTAKAYGC